MSGRRKFLIFIAAAGVLLSAVLLYLWTDLD